MGVFCWFAFDLFWGVACLNGFRVVWVLFKWFCSFDGFEFVSGFRLVYRLRTGSIVAEMKKLVSRVLWIIHKLGVNLSRANLTQKFL